MIYNEYRHLVGRRYISGSNDCYGLGLAFYKHFYSLSLTDFARPEGWWDENDFDLISDMVNVDEWNVKAINPRNLKPGDALVFSLFQTGKANHVGMYLGNGMFLHHLYGRLSKDESLTPAWTSRLLMVLEHPWVIQMRDEMRPKTDYSTLLPENVKRQIPELS